MITATPRPVSIILGKIRSGSWVSSTMLTESSKPTIAKNATEVAAVTARNRPLSSDEENVVIRDRSPSPWLIAQKPAPITMNSAAISTSVSTTLNFTDSPTPRRFRIAASSSMNASASTMQAGAAEPRSRGRSRR